MGSVGVTTAKITTDAQDKTINKLARQTRDLKSEQLRIVNEAGEVVYTAKGGAHEVASTVGVKRQFDDGAVVIHNHPAGGTFSQADLRDFGYGARQIVVATPEGTYYLTNLKYGTPEAKSGWLNMFDKMDETGITNERSFLDIRKEAQQAPHIVKLSDQMKDISNQWVQARNAGATPESQQKLLDTYGRLEAQYHTAIQKEQRRVETQPTDDFYKKNARKYGFEYTFVKR